MRLDHVSYVTSHEQLSDTVQRIGSRLGATFIDGGIHPRFGTRNFTAPLKDNQYLEIVCPLEHPASELTPWGRVVSAKALQGGGWLTWVFSTENLTMVEERFRRKSIEGHRTRPDGTELRWKQIGVSEIYESKELPFFIQWLTNDHPSSHGSARASLEKIVISSESKLADSWFQEEIMESLGNVEIQWIHPHENDDQQGIAQIHFQTDKGIEIID